MIKKDANEIKEMLRDFLSDATPAAEFCTSFEKYVNFELDTDSLEPDEMQIIKNLFDAVSWFSPFEEDRKSYKGFKSEGEIKTAVEAAAAKLRIGA